MECKGENVMTHRAIGSLLCSGVFVLAATMFGVVPSGPAQAAVAVAFALAAVRLMGAI